MIWIGGPPGAGKTTLASRLARRHGLRLYSTDTRTWAHRARALSSGSAAARRWEELRPRNDFSACNDEELLAMSLHYERGPMALADVRALPSHPPVIAEGSIVPHTARPGVWLMPAARPRDRLAGLLYDAIARDAPAELQVARTDDLSGRFDFSGGVTTCAERSALIHEANVALADQIRGFYAHPWAHGDPEMFVRAFACECGDPACTAELELPVGAMR